MTRDAMAGEAWAAAWDAEVTLHLVINAGYQVPFDRLAETMAVVVTSAFWAKAIEEYRGLAPTDAADEIIRAGWLPGVTLD